MEVFKLNIGKGTSPLELDPVDSSDVEMKNVPGEEVESSAEFIK